MSAPVTLSFHGAARTVTGSCMLFEAGGTRVLVDCGLFQGSRTLERLNATPFAFDQREIDAAILSHAHIDHSGLLPKLVAEGFNGPIWCTEPTAQLLEFMLADSGRIHESEAERRNRRSDRAGEVPFAPIYTERDALKAWRLCETSEIGAWFEPAKGVRARFWNAGHILGSASVELDIGGVRIICSGDLGPDNKAFHPDPEGPHGFDHVICETTYGDREREPVTIEARRKLLQAEVHAALLRGGNLVVPTFALERTQELLLDLGALARSGAVPNLHVFVDSPLANRVTEVFSANVADLEDTGGANVFAQDTFRFVDSVEASKKLKTVSGAVILAASGMCEGGRIRHHLLNNLHRSDSTVLFVGYQARGSLGRVILDGADTVRISGRDVRVRAQIRRIDSYSAHADQGELLAWIEERGPIAGSLFLTHGEEGAIETMRRELQRRDPDLVVKVPEIGEAYALTADAPAKRIRTGRAELNEAVGQDWQNEYAAFASTLKTQLSGIASPRARTEAIEKMRALLEGYRT